MATAKKRSYRRLSLRSLILIGLLLLAALVAFAYRDRIMGYSTVGAAYGARIGCSCRYVSGLPLSQCRKALDVEDGPSLLFLSEDEDNQSVTARVPLLTSQTARYRKGWGCVLEPWDD